MDVEWWYLNSLLTSTYYDWMVGVIVYWFKLLFFVYWSAAAAAASHLERSHWAIFCLHRYTLSTKKNEKKICKIDEKPHALQNGADNRKAKIRAEHKERINQRKPQKTAKKDIYDYCFCKLYCTHPHFKLG